MARNYDGNTELTSRGYHSTPTISCSLLETMTNSSPAANYLFHVVINDIEQHFVKVELHLQHLPDVQALLSLLQNDISHPHAATDMQALEQHLSTLSGSRSAAVVLIGSKSEGWLTRADITTYRLQNIPEFPSIYDLKPPSTNVTSMLKPSQIGQVYKDIVKDLFSSAISAIVVEGSDPKDLQSLLNQLSEKLSRNLNIPLTVPQHTFNKVIGVVGGGYSPAFRIDMFKAAAAARLHLVIMDDPTHWLNSWKHPAVSFVPIDLALDDGLCDRLIAACQSYGQEIHGVTTFSDYYRTVTASLAVGLGLQTDSPDALDICVRKDKFRRLFPIENYKSFCCSSVEDLERHTHELAGSFPVIIKPRSGGNSAGVHKIDSLGELMLLVKAQSRLSSEILVEKYIDGPEFDINIVLIDGSIVFHDINDASPCSAERNGRINQPASFIEDKMIWPSMLPLSEQLLVKRKAQETATKLGFTDGIFHMEGRVIGSSMAWSLSTSRQTPKFESIDNQPKETPQAMLIEINPRSPGYSTQAAYSAMYGVDYVLIQLLLCADDKERARILSIPFANPNDTCVITQCIHTPRAGIFYGENMFDVLQQQFPLMMTCVISTYTFFRDGDVVNDPKDRPSWVALFVVKTDNGREEAVKICEEIIANIKYEIC
ncbi:hypothetical protein QQS21_010988 [Conoideocrella luteorostrata]|uniref:ATP-grasp domain-containing protein n=1 Tax=Conoideocrella luteorostrata TaxID=1105319 RepID=A0AAJ0CDZ2_9HYPO|nr:hypothetical protein QQS21_010988 [Conoideocrella luteorostrata]